MYYSCVAEMVEIELFFYFVVFLLKIHQCYEVTVLFSFESLMLMRLKASILSSVSEVVEMRLCNQVLLTELLLFSFIILMFVLSGRSVRFIF